MTVLYSVLHFLVDGVCAMAMFGEFILQEDGYLYILLYNFCAFALQMPFGAVLDALNEKWEGKQLNLALATAAVGILGTVAGAFTHPVILGIGNALFHVGGGMGTIWEDHAKDRHGVCLGFFVAPGALGLYFGTFIAQGGGWKLWLSGAGIFMAFLLWLLFQRVRKSCLPMHGQLNGNSGIDASCMALHSANTSLCCGEGDSKTDGYSGKQPAKRRFWQCLPMLCCFFVVVLRSHIGMTVGFSWKAGYYAGALSVLALAAGKALGGLLAAWKGVFRTTVVSLVLAAFCYLFSFVMPIGLAALLFFNMTMPITLYWMVCYFPKMPGFAFGFLTFALFLGFLPGYFGMKPILEGNVIGCMGSMISLLLLGGCLGREKSVRH